MFRDDRQICEAVRALLHSVRLQHLWTSTGPTEEAMSLRERRGGPMSHGEALMLLVAFDFWNGHGKVTLSDLLGVLDSGRLQLVASLMIAVAQGADSVDRWLAEHRVPPSLRTV